MRRRTTWVICMEFNRGDVGAGNLIRRRESSAVS